MKRFKPNLAQFIDMNEKSATLDKEIKSLDEVDEHFERFKELVDERNTKISGCIMKPSVFTFISI